ncbi:MAG: hypothetical protein Q9170_005259, partial [Blastenia crenularia]
SDWAYDASYNWGAIQPDYGECQTGTQQSPIALSLTAGLSQYHHPTFENYDRNFSGNWTNWGYGPSFNLAHPPDEYTELPSMNWDDETAYLKGWHIHAPADHSEDDCVYLGGADEGDFGGLYLFGEGGAGGLVA